jgi:NAD(P) transhydrogenase subunit alpha
MHTLDLWSMLFVFMLATFVGFQVIQNVSRLLHTPLMSLTNAISAIAIVGSIIIAGEEKTVLSTVMGAVAVAASMTNIVSGFLITDRMLKMFREREAAMNLVDHLTQATYLSAAALFIFSLRWLSTPKTARQGVAAGVAGMTLAVVGTLLHPEIVSYRWILDRAGGRHGHRRAALVGAADGSPQRTALSHAFGGLAAGLVARRSTCCGCRMVS